MLVCLYGADTYRSKGKLKEIVNRYLALHSKALNFKEFDCETDSAALIGEELQAQSLFAGKKLIVVRNACANPQAEADLLSQKKVLQQENHVVVFWQGGDIKKESKLFQFLLKAAACQEFLPLSKSQTLSWIQKTFAAQGAKPQHGVAEFLFEACGNNLWRLDQEIKKLCAFSMSRGRIVGLQDTKALVPAGETADIFSTIDQIGFLQKAQALEEISVHLQNGESPLYLLTMIGFQFRNMLIAKDAAQKNYRAKLHPFVLQKSRAMLLRLPKEMPISAFGRVVEFDRAVKTGELQGDIAPYLFIAQL